MPDIEKTRAALSEKGTWWWTRRTLWVSPTDEADWALEAEAGAGLVQYALRPCFEQGPHSAGLRITPMPAGWRKLDASPRDVETLLLSPFSAETLDCVRAAVSDPLIAKPWLFGWLDGEPDYGELPGWVRGVGKKGSPEVRARLAEVRRQAVAACPLLILHANENGLMFSNRRTDLWSSIDERRPLAETLARINRLEPWAVRTLFALRLEDIVSDQAPAGSVSFGAVSGVLAGLRRGQEPSTPGQWERAFACRRMLLPVSTSLPRSEMDRLGRGWRDIEPMVALRAGLRDVISDLGSNLVRPIVLSLIDERLRMLVACHVPGNRGVSGFVRRLAAGILTKGVSARSLAKAGELWHTRHQAIHARLAAAYPTDRDWSSFPDWEPLTAPFEAPGGWGIRFVTSRPALQQLGREQRHCVASHAWRCAKGEGHVATVTCPDGSTASTFSVSHNCLREALQGGLPARSAIGEHLAAGNTHPPDLAHEVVSAWAGALDSGHLDIPWDALDRTGAIRRRQLLDLGMDEGGGSLDPPVYQHERPGAVEAAWIAYASILPDGVRRMGLEALRAEVAAALVPEISELQTGEAMSRMAA